MDWNDSEPNRNAAGTDKPRPTMADDRSAQADDAQVIERTQPARSERRMAERVRGNVERVAGATRGYVSKSPLSAALAAAAGGAALAGLALLVGHRAHSHTPAPLHGGLRRLRAAIR